MKYDEENPPESAIDEILAQTIEETVREDLERVEEPRVQTPKELFIIPIARKPFFPGMAAPLFIEHGVFYEVLKLVAKSSHKCVGVVLTKKEDADLLKVNFDDLCSVGVLARILRIIPIEPSGGSKGGAQVVFSMESRIALKKQVKSGKFLKAAIKVFDQVKEETKELKAYSISIISTIKELLKLNPLFKEELQIFLSHSDFTAPGKLADFAVTLTTAQRDELQEVLEAFDLQERIDKALLLLKKELDLSRLQKTIHLKMDAAVSKTQRDYFLKEQLKIIRKELGMDKEEGGDRVKFEERLKNKTPSDEVIKVIGEEMEKLQMLDPNSGEYAVCRNYLDWLTSIPWGVLGVEQLDLAHAKRVLDEDHYGLKDVKERILEYISVGKLSGKLKSNIIGLLGPPGVGKTSVGKSIAKALGRPFYRFSVGGMRDEAEIKGHRRTYVGAMPGKLIQALKRTGVMNPVILIDEVDKMGSSYHGDPASALLEVLDPEQNKDFLDHFLDVRCDLSDVLFLVTANVLDAIPEPLKDRLEILRLSGYIMEEKVAIANRYLIPKNLEKMGLAKVPVVFFEESIQAIVQGYAREAGVRNLEKCIKKILRKVAYMHVESESKRRNKGGRRKAISIFPTEIKKFLGKPEFLSDRFYEKAPAGVSTGLAWTSMGGTILYVETIKVPSEKLDMKLTGQAGNVMKESAQIAWSYFQSTAKKYAPEATFFKKEQIHVHIPEGAVPKDGPSAGIAMVTALLSLLKGVPIADDLGMTGEITLTGKILPIGGVKEKFIAGKRAGLKTIIFPKENERDYEELPDYVKKDMNVFFFNHYEEVFHVAFP